MSEKIKNKNIVDEMSNSFLDYAMSVIVSRALPDVRDGLKPVHRRILYAMNQLGNTPDKPYKKSARIVGDVIGKYHPHGDSAIYDAMVRMAQDFSFRTPLVDGHGNFGSIDGDGAAAMRYTEARMAKIAVELLRDINKNTVNFQENYDGSELEPVVLPGKFPNLLVNGSTGIAVGMATSIPPHNLAEVIDGVKAYLDNRDITIEELLQYIKGPDFPLGGQILGVQGIINAYKTGKGSVKVRSKYQIIEEKNDRSTIIVTEIPYQVNKASLVEKIADAVNDKRIEGISDLRDESDRDGVRIVIELKRGVTPEVIINNLCKFTQFESSFSINLLALVNGKPEVLNLKQILVEYVKHQKEVIERKTQFELTKAKERIHILNGLKIAVDNIDRVIKIIRQSKTTQEASESLIKEFEFSTIQVKAILEMRLQKLTGLEIENLSSEIEELLVLIADLEDILANEKRVDNIIYEDLLIIKEKYQTKRRSEILENYISSDLDYENLIEEEEVIVVFTNNGYIKRMSLDMYRVQKRGGKGLIGVRLNNEDEVKELLQTSTHSDLLFFTNTGRVFKTRTHQVIHASRSAKGIPIVNLIDLEANESISKIISVKEYQENNHIVFVTKEGLVKKTEIREYERVNKNGKIALSLNDSDTLVSVFEATDEQSIIVSTRYGKAVHSQSTDFRPLGRTARGVKGIRFKNQDDYVIDANVARLDDFVLTVTENGFGKMTKIEEYRIQKRGGSGIKNIKTTEKNGLVAAVKVVTKSEIENDDLLLITQKGQSIRIPLESIKITSRATQGVIIMRLKDDYISTLELLSEEKEGVDGEEVN